ncbi:MAG: hypothetical protein JJE51_13415 [Thermoanaerobaculia bacterium]|nr:hypothetical protein [Thermoanaerobaculia bacterium]
MTDDTREIAHRFNNVLMGISPHVEIIKRASKDNQRVLDSITQIELALKKAKEITDQMRASRPE